MTICETLRCYRCGKNWPSALFRSHQCAADLDPSIVPPEPRADSLPYEPSEEQAFHSPMLAACWRSGMTESQTIEMLWRSHRRLQVQVERLMTTQMPARLIVAKDPER